MKAQHTPGPWEALYFIGATMKHHPDGRPSHLVANPNGEGWGWNIFQAGPLAPGAKEPMLICAIPVADANQRVAADADARLLAVAPELLAMVVRLLDIAESVVFCEDHYISDAKALILKATGESE